MVCLKQTVPRSSRLLKKLQMQGRREEEPGAYWVVREEFRRPRTQQMDFFSSLVGDDDTA
jgi:hypothetical protein